MFEYFGNDKLCMEAGWLISSGILTEPNYKALIHRNKMNRLQRGGNGRPALIEYASIPPKYQQKIIDKLGYDPTAQAKHTYFRKHLVIDKEAVTYFSHYQLDNGHALPIERQREYHQNAMFLNALHEVRNKMIGRRRTMGGRTGGIWENLSEVISDLQHEFGHTLPGNAIRLKRRYRSYIDEGYPSLIHRGYGNSNSRKVNETLEMLILSIYVMNNKPYPVMVRDIYLEFLSGKVDIINRETGELFDRNDFYNEKGLPIVISEATIWNYVNNPKNRAIVDSQRNDFHYYNNIHRPHHHRHRPEFSLSKLSLDDRDLPYGKTKVGDKKIRVKAYYAYDVASGCLIGAAYSKKKDEDLYIACMRDMFGFLNQHSLGFPLELEVEHHIVNKFADDLMLAGNVFPYVRWCNAGNSQEKRAEHLNRAKKYGYEKRYLDGVGRFTLTEANRPKQDKVWDDDGMHLKDKIFDFEDLVAMDRFTNDKFNNSLHPDQKKFKGMSRLQVLLATVNPNAVKFQPQVVAQYAGEHVSTSIRRNQYVRVNYANYQLPDVNIIGRLQSNNYKVEAYYLPGEDGVIDEVHIFQNGQYIATCQKINRYNEATAEQTEEDHQYFADQSKYVAQFDSMIRNGRADKTAKLEITSAEDYSDMKVEVHETVQAEDYEYEDIDYANKALEDL